MNELDNLLRIIFDHLQQPTQPAPNRIISRYSSARDEVLVGDDTIDTNLYNVANCKWSDAINHYVTYDANDHGAVWL